jgi:hypothetical protein
MQTCWFALERQKKPPEVFSALGCEHSNQNNLFLDRGRPNAVSPKQIGWVGEKVRKLQRGRKGAVSPSNLRKLLNKAYMRTQRDRHRASEGLELGRRAMRTALAQFRKLHGVTFNKRNVRTPARAFQEIQVRNYASFVATFQAFANSPE